MTLTNKWLCKACIGWRLSYPAVANCGVCTQPRHVGRGGYCRLCWRTASTAHRQARPTMGRGYIPIDVAAFNRNGQQLFFTSMERASRHRQLQPVVPAKTPLPAASDNDVHRPRRPTAFQNVPLFHDGPGSWAEHHGIGPPADIRLAIRLETLTRDLAARHRWSKASRLRTEHGLQVLLAQPRDRGAPIAASAVDELRALEETTAQGVRLVLSEAGLLHEDRVAAIDRWFPRQIEGLPPAMQAEMTAWFDVMRHGSPSPPRRRARSDITIRLHVRYGLPALREWAILGHGSLREVSRDDVLTVLPAGGNDRALTGVALRSIFRILRGRRLVFFNPTNRINTGRAERRQPIPLDVEIVRDLLQSPDPAKAALTALIAFYGLGRDELRNLQLTDIRDRRLHLDRRRSMPIPPAVQQRLTTYLDYRTLRWPTSPNPHLFINHLNSCQHTTVGPMWIWRLLGVSTRLIREDCILDEAHACPGDHRRLCDLFNMTVGTAERYMNAIEHPDLAAADDDWD